ncbi:papain-like cysteine protease family protein [Actinokineospora auranticolor]|uniref:Papain like cysteine protease AvrRpt2 n=1 Tax=Actinokineospora auranticolor TaxID=155976 RepID=A0A2S6GQZ2_9PSEU|nr:papain-like cysteine protease family protein [Actinokineospora auranticolor]PPK67644.1 papain like cysteine protease AvrRpt2 [Actinokineospora auranticolor]
MADEPDLAPGDSSEWVAYLQQMLNHHYQQGVVGESGEFDDTTAGAVSHFADQNGLSSGDRVDSRFWDVLLGRATGETGETGGGDGGGGGGGGETGFQDIDYPVELLSQPDETTCWAASMVMVLNARGQNYTVESLCAEAGVDHQGKTWAEAEPIGKQVGMSSVYCACWTEQGWAEVLAESGPLWTPVPGAEYHIIVVAGIRQGANGAEIHVFDPWPPGAGVESWQDFASFTQRYEMGEGYGADLLRY